MLKGERPYGERIAIQRGASSFDLAPQSHQSRTCHTMACLNSRSDTHRNTNTAREELRIRMPGLFCTIISRSWIRIGMDRSIRSSGHSADSTWIVIWQTVSGNNALHGWARQKYPSAADTDHVSVSSFPVPSFESSAGQSLLKVSWI